MPPTGDAARDEKNKRDRERRSRKRAAAAAPAEEVASGSGGLPPVAPSLALLLPGGIKQQKVDLVDVETGVETRMFSLIDLVKGHLNLENLERGHDYVAMTIRRIFDTYGCCQDELSIVGEEYTERGELRVSARILSFA